MVRSLVVYTDFKKRLTKITDLFGATTGYTFNSTNPDYVFKNADGYAWPVEGLGISNNGQWLAVEFRGKGIGVLDMNSFQMKRLSTISPAYGQGTEPLIEMAITNNGQHVAMMGINYGAVSVYDIYPTCGDEASDRNMHYIMPIDRPCTRLTLDNRGFITRFMAGFNPRFDDEGGQLDFFAKSYDDNTKAVTLHANGYTPQQLDYLALGDSFTSGEGETDDSQYQSGTNDEFEKCHLSKRSYPYLIAASLGIDSQNMRSVACSGATTGDIVGEDQGYWGQGNRLDEGSLGLNSITKSVYQASAKDLFNPGRIHQIRFVERYKPKLITIGIGGNDVGFMEKLKSCVGPSTCKWAHTAEGREKTAFEIQRVFDTLAHTYSSIREASPTSKIYAMGYPKVIDPSGQCSVIDGILLNTIERTFMDEGIIYINQVIAAAAKKAGVRYIDIESSFGNTVLCGVEAPSVMNSLILGNDIAPTAKLSWLKIIGNETFHPKPTGHERIHSGIQQTIPNVLTYDHCVVAYSKQNNSCPMPTTTAPQPSNYWLADGINHNYSALRIAQFVRHAPDKTDLRHKSITLPDYTFAAGSVVRVEIHSDPIALGSTTATTSGGLSYDIELPENLEQGFHTVHVYGTSYSGEQVDLYQVITYALPTIDVPIVQQTGDSEQPTATVLSPDTIAQDQPSLQTAARASTVAVTNTGSAVEPGSSKSVYAQINPSSPTDVMGQDYSSDSQFQATIPWLIAGGSLVIMSIFGIVRVVRAR